MFIEIAELLRCPREHDESFCVVSPDRVVDRRVMRGVIGCPTCRAEYPIENFIVDFAVARGSRDESGGDEDESRIVSPADATIGVDAHVIQALLNLSGPGGSVALIGTAVLRAVGLADTMAGIHYIGVNAPAVVGPTQDLTLVTTSGRIPVRSSSMRGVVLGAEYAGDDWIVEATRVLLRGMRLVTLSTVATPKGITKLAMQDGVFVGQKD